MTADEVRARLADLANLPSGDELEEFQREVDDFVRIGDQISSAYLLQMWKVANTLENTAKQMRRSRLELKVKKQLAELAMLLRTRP